MLSKHQEFLWKMLYQALFVPKGHKPFPQGIIHHPDLSKYAKNWGNKNDIGLIAIDGQTKEKVGAAWLGLFTKENKGYGYVDDAIPPKWIKARKEPELDQGKVTVTGFINGWCPAYNMVFERAKRASLELGDQVVFHEINTFDKEVFDEWGISDSLFINRKKVNTGPPPSYKKIKKKISKEIKKQH
jgi:hypothetical protein